MPQLPSALANQARDSASEGATFAAFDPGVYTAKLSKLEATTSKSSDNPMWALEFDSITDLDGVKKPGRLWTNLVLTDAAMWKVGQFFLAFGVDTNVNTENLIGHRVRLDVTQRVQTAGKRAGQLGNDISAFIALEDGDEGYAALKKMQSQTGKPAPAKAAPAKAAPAKAAAPKAEPAPEGDGSEPAGDASAEEWADADSGAVDF